LRSEADPATDLVGRIYEAAVIPALWKPLLDELARATGALGGVLFSAREISSQWIVSDALQSIYEQFIGGGWDTVNQRPARLMQINKAGFVCDQDLFTQDELQDDAFYRDFLRPRGLGFAAGTLIRPPSKDVIVVSFERALQMGPFDGPTMALLDGVRPHLARGALLASRLGLERARMMTEALQVVGWPCAVLRGGGRLIAANALFEGLMPDIVQSRSDRVVLTDPVADGLFEKALRSAQGLSPACARSIPIRARQDRPAYIVHQFPLQGQALDLFTGAASLMLLTPVDSSEVPTAELLQGLFDLSPAEARVARAIGQAQTIDAIAADLDLSRETIRSQLKAVLTKTGLKRQAELVSLLASSLPTPRG